MTFPFAVNASSESSGDSVPDICVFDGSDYQAFDASDSYNFYRSQTLVENLSLYDGNVYDSYLICNIHNKHFTTSLNGSVASASDYNAVYTVMLFNSDVDNNEYFDYKSTWDSSGNLNFIYADPYDRNYSKSNFAIGYITIGSDGMHFVLIGQWGNQQVALVKNGSVTPTGVFFGWDYDRNQLDSSLTLAEYISNGMIYKDHVHIIEPNFFQTARILRKTLSPILPEIVPVGISALCLIVLLVVLVRCRGLLVRAFRV